MLVCIIFQRDNFKFPKGERKRFMKRNKKRLFSWMLALAITFTTIFGNVGFAHASETGADDSTVVQEITSEQPSTAQEEVLDENKGEDGQKQQNEENKEENQQTAEEGILQESSEADQKKVEESTPLESDGNDQNAGNGENSVTDSGSDEKTDKEDNLEQDSSKLPSEDAQKQEKVNLQPVIMKSTAPANAQQTSDAGVDAATSATMPVSISDALAAQVGLDSSITVKGVVTLIEGKNIYIQDETGAICVRVKSNPTDLTVGDTIKGKGKRGEYKGLKQLDGSGIDGDVYFKVSAENEKIALNSTVKTLKDLTEADVAKYVEIKNLTVTEVSGDNVTVTDDNGTTTINIYKGVYPEGKTPEVGNVITFKGAVGTYNGLQLRNTLDSEITVVSGSDVQDPNEGDATTDKAKKVDIKDAITVGTNYQVTGTVIMVYNGNKSGQEIYVRDTTGGIGVFLGKKTTILQWEKFIHLQVF